MGFRSPVSIITDDVSLFSFPLSVFLPCLRTCAYPRDEAQAIWNMAASAKVAKSGGSPRRAPSSASLHLSHLISSHLSLGKPYQDGDQCNDLQRVQRVQRRQVWV